MMINSNLNKPENYQIEKLPKAVPMDFNYELGIFLSKINTSIFALPLNSNEKKLEFKEYCNDETEFPSQNFHNDSKFKELLRNNSLFIKPDFKLLITKYDMEIFKGKYFNLKVALQALSAKSFPINECVELEIMLFTNDNTLITKNMKGQEIIRGNFVTKMHFSVVENRHIAVFRIQITEVSSHFIGKTVNLKVKVKKNEYMVFSNLMIQPAWIENLSVKAKRAKVT